MKESAVVVGSLCEGFSLTKIGSRSLGGERIAELKIFSCKVIPCVWTQRSVSISKEFLRPLLADLLWVRETVGMFVGSLDEDAACFIRWQILTPPFQ
jgi:hypothetical protein